MRVAIIGAGPAGLFVGSALALRGHEVVAVDRDSRPPPGHWARPGVMQFHHAHGFRPQVGLALKREWPQALDAWLAAGAEPIEFDVPGMGLVRAGHRSRRDTFERALRTAAERVPGLTIGKGHVDDVVSSAGRVRGIVVDGSPVAADLVVDASGRSGHSVDALRAPASLGGPCGMAYVDRQYRLLEGAEPGPMSNPLAWQGDFDGYQVLVFLHEQGHFSVVLVRPTADAALKDLRHRAAFEAACRAIPGLAAWTDPERAVPVTDVLPGGPLRNTYRGQRGRDGRPCIPGLVSVGDAVATTTPIFGRGVATTFVQALQLLSLLDGEPDPALVGEPFDAWCGDNMLPWVADHVEMDRDVVRRWEGGDVDLTRRLPSDLILAAARRDPRIGPATGGYFSMLELPACLDPVEPLARAVYETGWRPEFTPGPTRGELRDVVAGALRKDERTASRA
ncbi:FAD-dependent oxidoreductase [Blastococcus sp. CT_GayMR20]|uniref:FAD-dependent oxidoreductase n=1 Tax=Blastococcus sp. CT_GayMR20 TaxID=2559609 RepID=UPI001073139E|nr:FAD-dependent monooxygenase [Blastococcus sp. CT_GayMR20]TFV92797.1 FAD-dependent oxidoreductase [Blastococcus sp. CT_GayMR20]TFV92866.1 FAD-dependent oxidoreductase [Blastococcus sp. CT_GayMR20]